MGYTDMPESRDGWSSGKLGLFLFVTAPAWFPVLYVYDKVTRAKDKIEDFIKRSKNGRQ